MRRLLLALGAAMLGAACSVGAADTATAPEPAQTLIVTEYVTPPATDTPTPSPTPVASLGSVVEEVSDGVVRLEVTGCEGWTGSGSGFIIDSGMVATVAHVVDGARTLSLRNADGVIRGEIVGIDRDRDLAVVRAIRPLDGNEFEFSDTQPEITDKVAVLGYPYGRPLSVTLGNVTGLDRRVELEDRSIEGTIETDAVVNPGNSGGPLLDAAGNVLGLVDAGGAGLAYAIPSREAAELLTAWASSPSVQAMEDCPNPYGDLVSIESLHADAPALAATFYQYFAGINSGWYQDSYDMLTGEGRQRAGSYEEFADGHSTSVVSNVTIELVELIDETSDWAEIRFRSTQAPEYGPDGQTCTDWHLRYTMRADDGIWLIDYADNLAGSPRPCPGN